MLKLGHQFGLRWIWDTNGLTESGGFMNLACLHFSERVLNYSWNCRTTWDFSKSSLLHSPAPWVSWSVCTRDRLGVVQLLLPTVMSGTKLTQLFLFNPSWGPREGQEEEKVVFHWPAHLDANTRVRSVGLIEAVVRWEEILNGLFWLFKVWSTSVLLILGF